MDSISVIGYRDLGKNVAQSLTNVSAGLYDRGCLHKVYPRGVVETDLPPDRIETPLPFGRYGPSFLWLLSERVYEFDHRTYSMQLVDYFVSWKLESDAADVAYFDIPGFQRGIETSRDRGKLTIVRGSTEMTTGLHERLKREYRRLGVDYSLPGTRRQFAERRKQSLERADKLIALSKFVRDSYVDAGLDPGKIRVINNAVDVEKFDRKTDYGGPFRALFVGQISVRKGIPTLLEAWERFDDGQSELVLCGSVSADVKAVSDPNGASNVTLTGWVDPEPYYRDATVFVLPSLSEGFAKVILEAMSTGTPVVVSENSGGADVVEDGVEGFVVTPGDPSALVEKLQYFRDNPGEVERMGRNARRTAEEHTWDRYVDEVLSFVESGT